MREVTLALQAGGTLQVEIADSPWTRFLGLMGRQSLAFGRGLLLMRCSSLHMCFMRFELDVVYLDADFHVTKVATGLRPWRFSVGAKRTRHALEVSVGTAKRLGIEVGDVLHLDPPMVAA